jgi:hypothetical protein
LGIFELTHFTVIREQERQRRQRREAELERSRLEREKLTWAELSAQADRKLAHDMLLARQRWNYNANLQKLFALADFINK